MWAPALPSIPNTAFILDHTTLPNTDGAALATWTARTGASLAQATAAQQPTVKTTDGTVRRPNGLPFVQFDGADRLDSALASSASGPVTLYVVAAASTWRTASEGLNVLAGSTATGGHGLRMQNAGTNLRFEQDGVSNLGQAAAAPGLHGWHVYRLTYANPGALTTRVDDAVILSSTSTTVVSTNRLRRIGDSANGSGGWQGGIAFVMQVSRVVTAAEDAQIMAYLKAVYGTGPRPGVPLPGSTLLGAGWNHDAAPQDGADFVAANGSGQASISSFCTFTTPNGTFAQALGQQNAVATLYRSARPEIAWQHPGPGTLADIAAGSDDAYMIARAQELAAYGKQVLLRWNWEANGDGFYPWCAYEQGTGAARPNNSPADYVAAWRRMHAIVRSYAPNVSFVWCPHVWFPAGVPNPGYAFTDWWPGDDYVDWVATDFYPGSSSWEYLIDGPWGANAIAQFATDHGKPMRLSEMGFGQGDSLNNAGSVYQFRDWLEAHPVVREIVYFQYSSVGGQSNYRIGGGRQPDVSFAYKTIIVQNTARYGQRG